jgi:DNA processing protein
MKTPPLTGPAFSLAATQPNFPTALAQCFPPVPLILGVGCANRVESLASCPGLAIVGSRQATAQGLADAHWFAREASLAGLTVISGLAQGIDAAAHRGALLGQGNTVAVLGHGRDSIYPRGHAGLAREIIAAGGALVTEYPDGVPALPHHFPNRNRIIAALARAVLVIEAAPKSGSLITARHALDLGVDVFVLPGSIHEAQSLGSNLLIRQGAQLVQSPVQLLEDLGLTPAAAAKPKSKSQPALAAPLDDRAQKILRVLGFQPMSTADLESGCQLAAGDLYAGLLLLEFSQLARRSADGRWSKLKVK